MVIKYLIRKTSKHIFFGLITGFCAILIGIFSANISVAAMNYDVWQDQGVIYTAPVGDAYYPSVIYDAGGFGGSGSTYNMWYGDGVGGVFLIQSTDGVSWGAPITMSGLAIDSPGHVQVLYSSSCFGQIPCDGAVAKYRIWYWRMNGPLYNITSIGTAKSVDGINWTDLAMLSQNPSAQLITGADSGWNRGSYGPIYLFYQSTAINTGTEPWDYSYVMYYDGTNGSNEETGLAYSVDGLTWSAYSGNPVMAKSDSAAWDCTGAVYGTVYRDINGYHFWYSGGGGDNGSGGCAGNPINAGIGYASSIDGKNWVRNVAPIMQISDGQAYRSGRTYTPAVINDGSGTLRMYFSAKDAASSVKKIGYATITEIAALHVIKQVVNDNEGAAIASSFNLHVRISGVDVSGSPAVGALTPGVSYSLSPGAYAVSEDTDASYAQSFSGDCDSSGNVILAVGDVKTCTIINNDIPPPAAQLSPVVSGGVGYQVSPVSGENSSSPITNLPPKIDLNNDNADNIADVSIFLFRWESADPALKASIDFNGDKKVDVSDFSILLNTIRLR